MCSEGSRGSSLQTVRSKEVNVSSSCFQIVLVTQSYGASGTEQVTRRLRCVTRNLRDTHTPFIIASTKFATRTSLVVGFVKNVWCLFTCRQTRNTASPGGACIVPWQFEDENTHTHTGAHARPSVEVWDSVVLTITSSRPIMVYIVSQFRIPHISIPDLGVQYINHQTSPRHSYCTAGMLKPESVSNFSCT